MYKAGNGHGFRFHKVEPMLNEWVAHFPLLGFGTVKNSPGLHELDQKRPCVVRMEFDVLT